MPPLLLLLTLSLVSTAMLAAARFRQSRQRRGLQRLAVEYRLHFSRRDQLRLTPRVAAALPTPGAAAVSVSNLIYGSAAGSHRYVFTVEYTLGVMRRRESLRQVAAFSEPRERASASEPAVSLALAPSGLPLAEQYRALLKDGARGDL